jgi:hypothetical protein
MIKFNLFDYACMLSFKIVRKVNIHSSCCFTVLIKDEDADSFASYLDATLEISYDNTDIFSGFIESIEVFKDMNKTVVEIIVSSFSKKIDIKKHHRIYQDTKQTYKSIIDSLNIDVVDLLPLDSSIASEVVDAVVTQMAETDYSFISKLFGIKGIPIVNDDISNKNPSLWIGKRVGVEHSLEDDKPHILLTKINNKILKFNKQYDVSYSIGDAVSFQGEKYWIASVEIYFKNSILHSNIIAESNYNIFPTVPSTTALTIKAKVINNKDPETKGRIQVDFSESEFDDMFSDNRHWFNVISPYSSPNKGYYFIPGLEEYVYVILGSNKVNYVLPTHSNVSSPLLSDPSHINLVVTEDIVLNLDEENFRIGNKETEVVLTEKLIQAVSAQEISFKGETLSMNMERGVKIKSSGDISSEASGTINLKGSQVKLN